MYHPFSFMLALYNKLKVQKMLDIPIFVDCNQELWSTEIIFTNAFFFFFFWETGHLEFVEFQSYSSKKPLVAILNAHAL